MPGKVSGGELCREHLNQIPEPPQLTALHAEDQQLYPEPLCSRTELLLHQEQQVAKPRGEQFNYFKLRSTDFGLRTDAARHGYFYTLGCKSLQHTQKVTD